jgi:hypothetical protein
MSETSPGYEPFRSTDGKLNFSTAAAPKEMEEWGTALMRRGFVSAQLLVSAFRFLRDASRIKNPIAKAERWQLALRELQSAQIASKHKPHPIVDAVVVQTLDQYIPQYLTLMTTALDAFHEEMKSRLNRQRTREKQLKIAATARKELARLENHQLIAPIDATYRQLCQYWQDQEMLLIATPMPE